MVSSMTHDVETHTHNPDPPKRYPDAWTDERIAILVDERSKGTARRIIADIINERTGSNFTKSSICGKIDRIFPAERPVKTEEEKAATRERQRERDRLKKQRKRAKAGAKQRYESIRIVSANGNSNAMRVIRTVTTDWGNLRCVDVDPRNLSLADMQAKDCRYPYGDGPFTFCGHPVQAGSSYCPDHHALCWVPPQARVDRKWSAAA